MKSHAVAVALLVGLAGAAGEAAEARPRARDLGIAPGVFPPGALDAITDVAGVSVGQVTLIEGERVRTGVTVIVPHAGNVFRDKVPAAVYVGNGFGKLAGSTQVDELGTMETPIVAHEHAGRGYRGGGAGAGHAGARRERRACAR